MDKRYVKIVISGRPITIGGLSKTIGTHGPVWLDTKDIFMALANGASVFDVSTDKEIKLTFTNYMDPVDGDKVTVTTPVNEPPVHKPVTGNFHPTNEPVLHAPVENPALPVSEAPAAHTDNTVVEPDDDNSNDGEPVKYQQQYHGNKKNKHR